MSVRHKSDFQTRPPLIHDMSAALGGRIDLWQIDLEVTEQEFIQCCEHLSEEDIDAAGSLARNEVRRRFGAARAGVRRILAAYVSCLPRALEIRRTAHGKPFVRGGPCFSVTHSGGLAFCAVGATRALGIDVERLRPVPDMQKIVHRWFNEAERREWESAQEPSEATFFRLWTLKEAYLKAVGVGLSEENAREIMDPERWEAHVVRLAGCLAGAVVVGRALRP